VSGAGLVERVARLYDGIVDGPGLVAAFRDAIVVVPTDGHDGVLTFVDRGLCWVPAFTDTTALARFALARGEAGRSWSYLSTRGSRLQDAILPALGRNAGIAVDVGSERPMFLPPTNPV
jgi:hypothetical protein